MGVKRADPAARGSKGRGDAGRPRSGSGFGKDKRRDHSDSKDKRRDHSDSKDAHSPSKTKKPSGPQIEYVLDDATPEERTLIKEGTMADRINCLSLLCARSPTVENYKQLLFFAENQRNDVMYHVLKNLRDLLREKIVDDLYIRGRIVKTFDRGLKNQYIKEKVIDLVGVLVRTGVYVEEFASLLVERLLEKDKALRLVETELKRIILKHQELVVSYIEDFYYKNDTFRVQYIILRFLSTVDLPNPASLFDFYNQALTTLDTEYPTDQYNLMLDCVINGLSISAEPGAVVERIELVRNFVGSPKTVISCLRLLTKLADPFLEAYIIRTVKSSILRATPQEADFLNVIAGLDNKSLITKIVNDCFFYSVSFIIAVMLIASEKGVDPSGLYSIAILIRHYHPAVREAAAKLMRDEPLPMYDPYDRVLLDSITAMY
ncbi:hypothetical protein PAPHI01_2428 [Pancytospora philotis]|nr:hypothetical protein PAPHI01_1973 [Pancytospora philotis]KAI4293154.1 hypothetical protein PAPHI01_2428 [Pancytospora philotis]